MTKRELRREASKKVNINKVEESKMKDRKMEKKEIKLKFKKYLQKHKQEGDIS